MFVGPSIHTSFVFFPQRIEDVLVGCMFDVKESELETLGGGCDARDVPKGTAMHVVHDYDVSFVDEGGEHKRGRAGASGKRKDDVPATRRCGGRFERGGRRLDEVGVARAGARAFITLRRNEERLVRFVGRDTTETNETKCRGKKIANERKRKR